MSKSRVLSVVIPAAGFGTRMGLPIAKEMLVNPVTGLKFVNLSLQQAKKLGAKVILITRKEKKELIDHVSAFCEEQHLLLEILQIEPTSEWPETVLMSQHCWTEKNLLVLPDTDWKPADFLQEMIQEWEQHPSDVIYGVFESNKNTWGYVKAAEGLWLCEKPAHALGEGFMAWGFIGFKKEIGSKLFREHLTSTFDHQVKFLKISAQVKKMAAFFDRTRGESPHDN
jgi:hypothetical protein